MGLQKGHTNNPSGRPKGSQNKVTNELRSWVHAILAEGRKQFEKDLNELAPTERIRVYTQLLGYAIPKPVAVDPVRLIEAWKEMIERLLIEAPERAVDLLANKIGEVYGSETGRERYAPARESN